MFASYAMDIIIQFISPYLDMKTGDRIYKPSMIAKDYMRGDFAIDLLSTFPFQSFNELIKREEY